MPNSPGAIEVGYRLVVGDRNIDPCRKPLHERIYIAFDRQVT
jgi:hypothetical protein